MIYGNCDAKRLLLFYLIVALGVLAVSVSNQRCRRCNAETKSLEAAENAGNDNRESDFVAVRGFSGSK